MTTFTNDPTMPSPSFPGSHMVIDDHYVFISGLTVADLSNGEAAMGNIKEETRLVMRALSRMLEMEGGSIQDMDSVYAEYFEPGRYPARTCTEAPHICGGSSIEITVMAKRTNQ